jgi:hypothetical protein
VIYLAFDRLAQRLRDRGAADDASGPINPTPEAGR